MFEFARQIAKMTNEDGEKLKEVFVTSAKTVGDRMKAMGAEGSKKK